MTWPPRSTATSLDGHWTIVCDPDDRGVEAGWFRPGAEPDGGRPIFIPSAWQTALPRDYPGVAWLRTRIPKLPAAPCHWLRFESVATECAGWLDGAVLGRHVGDWVPFQWPLPAGAEGRELVLRIDPVRAVPPDRAGDLQRGHITKGFHDVISIAHAGVWQPVTVGATGRVVAEPDGVAVVANPKTGHVDVAWTLESVPARPGTAEIELRAANGDCVGQARVPIAARTGHVGLDVPMPRCWSPEDPALHAARVTLRDADGFGETHELRFGFRRVETRGRRILLNGTPLQIRGVLDWGHEPRHVAPAPTRDEIRSRFERLRAMGFNTVCLCMWYPPRAYYDLADETGMLLWQEHPVWQARMAPEDLSEYRRLYSAFLRRDRNHPSIVITSATCEHPAFDPELARWWWSAARAAQPHALLQLQTAFLRWADPDRTDLHDEHTYESSDRWVPYLEDLAVHLDALDRDRGDSKPFVMGETVLFTSWPRAVSAAARRPAPARAPAPSPEVPWHAPRGFDERVERERAWRARFGADTVERFLRDGDRFHLLGRKFQVEQFRRDPARAGLVMNHLRDVPACQCGFMDDDGAWRFEPEECRPWLGPVVLVLETPDQRRAFEAGETIAATIAVSNFGGGPWNGVVRIAVGAETVHALPVTVARGAAARVHFDCTLPDAATRPSALSVRAELVPRDADAAEARVRNSWRLWAVPAVRWPKGAARLDAAPLNVAERAPLPTERAYSKGYGLDVHAWTPRPPEAQVVAAELPVWSPRRGIDIGSAPSVVVTHRLTPDLRAWVESGGDAVLLASGASDSVSTAYEWLFGQVPLIIEGGPLQERDSEWLVDLLGYDLVRRWCRVIPCPGASAGERVQPFVRCAYTHDEDGVRELDLLYVEAAGRGRLVVTSLDVGDPIGRWLLARIAAWAAARAST